MPKSECRAWLQKLKSLILEGWSYRHSSVVPNVSALQKLHVDATDLLLVIGQPVSRIRKKLESLALVYYTPQRMGWRETRVCHGEIRRFIKLLIAAYRAVDKEHRAIDPEAVPVGVERATSEGAARADAAVAARRQRVVLPILTQKRWTRGKWATKSGVGKNCVYEYLDGKRNPGIENRQAMADALDLNVGELPD